MNLVDRLRASRAVKTHRAASEEEIAGMLRIARVKLPKDYREFLLGVGWVQIGPNIVYGLGPDATKAESIFENSLWEHVMADPPMHAALMPLMNDGSGNHYCLDTGKIKDGRCPIVFWDHEDDMFQKPKRIKASFELWLLDLVKKEEDLMD